MKNLQAFIGIYKSTLLKNLTFIYLLAEDKLNIVELACVYANR